MAATVEEGGGEGTPPSPLIEASDDLFDVLPFFEEEMISPEEEARTRLEREFLRAVVKSDLAKVMELVETQHVDVCCSYPTELDMPALHTAIARHDYALIAYLLDHGADPNQMSSRGTSPSAVALAGDCWDIRALDMLGACCALRGLSLKTPVYITEALWEACSSNNPEKVAKVLRKLHTSPSQRCLQTKGLSIFHWAVGHCSPAIVSLLLDAERANINALATHNPPIKDTPFITAIENNNREIGEMLVAASPAFITAQTLTRTTCLHLAVTLQNGDDALFWIDLILTRGGAAGRGLIDAVRDDGNTPLLLALANKRRKPQVIYRLLSECPRLDLQRRSDNCNAVHLAFAWSPEMAHKILDGPAEKIDLMQQREDGSTPLILALDAGSVPLAQRVLSMCPRAVTLSRADGMSPLHFAMAMDNKELFECLLAAGANPNAKLRSRPSSRRFGESILHLLIGPQSNHGYAKRFSRNPGLAMLLLNTRTNPELDINACRSDGFTPLMVACHQQEMPLISRLLELRADPNLVTEEGNCALHIAFERDNFDLCRMLVDAGANTSQPSPKRNGETLLMTVLQRIPTAPKELSGDWNGESILTILPEQVVLPVAWLRWLLDKTDAAGFMATRSDGSAAIHIACECGLEKEWLEEIVQKTPNLDIARAHGITPLHIACRKGDINAVRILLKHGANPKVIDEHRIAPLHVACHAGHAAIAKLLVSVGCDPQQVAGPIDVDEPDGNAVELARRAGNFRLARLLMDPLRS